ncbi:unnamed protein product [Cladocopium goreaui]|uniref:Sulfotransferase domain-containing protein n=1 Tax=Cladocopium goreaui TaxID=2562237 RepID=A0A9P1G427_9DINO|nr:unnamed protein product [Cladocopium goreaui]
MSRPRAPMRAPRAPHAPHAPQAPQAQRRQAQAAQEPQSEPDTSICPLPPYRSWLRPPNRTALASHPRSGSTWTRFLLERASSSACGFEDPGWANVLPHAGGVEGKPDDINEDGLIIKTHSICFGCWPDAPIWKRLRVRNTSLAPQEAHRLLGPTEVTEKLESIGTCLIFPPGSLEAAIKVRKNFNLEKKQAIQLHCTKMYDRAVVLIRDPLDVFRSNYHYRTKVLGLQRGRSWSKDQHAFVRERAEAWMNFYRSWRDFAQVRPAMLVYYELLKLNPAHEVQRMLQFLQVEVTPEKLTCAIEQTTMGKLKVDRSSKGRVDETRFFGSRKETEAKDNMGLFQFANSMGYISYQGLASAVAVASGESSRIEAVRFPWQLVEVAVEPFSAPAAPVSPMETILPEVTTSVDSRPAPQAPAPEPRAGTASPLRLYMGPQVPMEVSPIQSALGGLVVGLLCGMYLCRVWQNRVTKQARSS